MGFLKNVNQAWELKVALTPLASATSEIEFRRLLPAAEAAGDKVWGTGADQVALCLDALHVAMPTWNALVMRSITRRGSRGAEFLEGAAMAAPNQSAEHGLSRSAP